MEWIIISSFLLGVCVGTILGIIILHNLRKSTSITNNNLNKQ